MAQLVNYQNTRVYIKANWADNWQLTTLLEAQRASVTVSPGIGQAEFIWRYGYRTLTGGSDFVATSPLNLLGWFVQIRVYDPGPPENEVILFTGKFFDDALNVIGTVIDDEYNQVSNGDQILTASDLALLLDREVISLTRSLKNGNSIADVIEHVPSMNRQGDRGLADNGNRSYSRDADGVYRYSADGAYWSHLDYLEMILIDHQPDNIRFILGGQKDLLDNLRTYSNVEGLTVKGLLDKLVDRRRGFGWRIGNVIAQQDYADEVQIEIFTVFDSPITVGDITLTPNLSQIELDLSNEALYHVQSLRLNDSALYDNFVITGQRVKSCFSISKTEFVAGWTMANETLYRQGAKNAAGYDEKTEEEQSLLNDRYRNDARFSSVYRNFELPEDWDWTVDVNGSNIMANPDTDNDGGLTGYQGNYSQLPRTFMRSTILQRGIDYTGSVSVDNTSGSVKKYHRPMVFVQDVQGTWYNAAAIASVLKDDDGNSLPNIGVRMLDHTLGFALDTNPNHLLAQGHFEPAEPSAHLPWLNWENLLVTVTTETDQRLKISLRADGQTGPIKRTLKINVPGAELWYVADGTVVGLDESGQLERFGCSNVIRNDKAMLQAVAAAAMGWYGKARQALQCSIEYLATSLAPGQLVKHAYTNSVYEDVNTIITQINWDFGKNTTTLGTAYSQLDFAAITGMSIPDIGDFRAMGSEIKTLQKQVDDIAKNLTDIPEKVGGSVNQSGFIRLGVITETVDADNQFLGKFMDSDGEEVGEDIEIVCDTLNYNEADTGRSFTAVYRNARWWCTGIYEVNWSDLLSSELLSSDLLSSDVIDSSGFFSSDTWDSSDLLSSDIFESSGYLSSDAFDSSDLLSSDILDSSDLISSGAGDSSELLSSGDFDSSGLTSSDGFGSSGFFSSDAWDSSDLLSSDALDSSDLLSSDGFGSSGGGPGSDGFSSDIFDSSQQGSSGFGSDEYSSSAWLADCNACLDDLPYQIAMSYTGTITNFDNTSTTVGYSAILTRQWNTWLSDWSNYYEGEATITQGELGSFQTGPINATVKFCAQHGVSKWMVLAATDISDAYWGVGMDPMSYTGCIQTINALGRGWAFDDDVCAYLPGTSDVCKLPYSCTVSSSSPGSFGGTVETLTIVDLSGGYPGSSEAAE
ncbi:MAG: hypothetical protein JEZ07_06515 [Phycisphaerae bacterium]|nr:hypothetical protein [Phycisphaerae bacterium]